MHAGVVAHDVVHEVAADEAAAAGDDDVGGVKQDRTFLVASCYFYAS